jgi:hypothetical protein
VWKARQAVCLACTPGTAGAAFSSCDIAVRGGELGWLLNGLCTGDVVQGGQRRALCVWGEKPSGHREADGRCWRALLQESDGERVMVWKWFARRGFGPWAVGWLVAVGRLPETLPAAAFAALAGASWSVR